ncbi:conserved hypothetical protein [Pediculus humanus corporis]|uniref:SDE2-like domain-containing protein n=1 Tax=Pediculus humanus subsp. corporis TaxID=121224 RepID=E0W069_PEDHC|nr:uncharacterized protein Phum_PHUM546560 [Pediculus humanus corporis]EEB19025.1 conserved hypothetical protein [Pediculus humanus corporis]
MVNLILDVGPSPSRITLPENSIFSENELRQGATFDFYLLQNGKMFCENTFRDCDIHAIPRLCGGKGGFGSMLRAIGAQIEKTTNREACRDLSGRRLRDINEEKRLKKWIAEQAEREQEAALKKKKKLEKLTEITKHEFTDADYTKARLEMPEKIHESVEEGLKAAVNEDEKKKEGASTSNQLKKKAKKKKPIKGNLCDSDKEIPKKKLKVS